MESIAYLIYSLVVLGVATVLGLLWLFTKKHVFGVLLVAFLIWMYIAQNPSHGMFWEDFYPEKIIAEDLEREGSCTGIGWRADAEHFFTGKAVVKFAAQNEWRLVDSLCGSLDSIQLKLEKEADCDKNLDYLLFKDNALKHLTKGNHRVFFYDTGIHVLSIRCGKTSRVNGYTIISENGKLFRIFEYWNEM